MNKGTPASSQIIWLEGRIAELEAQLADANEMLEKCNSKFIVALEAENARLKAAMDKYSEELIERCAKVCEVMGFKHSECPEMSEYCADAIRALSPKRERREAKRRVSIEEYFGTGRRFLKDRRKT